MQRKCPVSWISSYLDYTRNQESPTAFHEWVGLCALSAAIGRNIWIPRIKYTIYPNLFVILVAGSARCKKSTAIGYGERVLQALPNPPIIFAQKITPEALIQTLKKEAGSKNSTGIICADELSLFMGRDATKAGVIPVLISLYDGKLKWTYQTVGRGKETLHNTTLTILAGTTPSDLSECIPEHALKSGFAARIIFVYQEQPSKLLLFDDMADDTPTTELFKETPDEIKLRKDLRDDLILIQSITGKVMLTAGAKSEALNWYTRESSIIRDKVLDGYYARKHDTMFKIAALLSISESPSLHITKQHINNALAILEENETHLGVITSSIITTPEGSVTERILNIIRRRDFISHSDLLGLCWRFSNAEDVSLKIRTLIESNEIEESLSSNNKTRIYKTPNDK